MTRQDYRKKLEEEMKVMSLNEIQEYAKSHGVKVNRSARCTMLPRTIERMLDKLCDEGVITPDVTKEPIYKDFMKAAYN